MTALSHGAPLTHRQPPRNRKFTEQIAANFLLDASACGESASGDGERLRGPLRTLLRSMGALLGIPVTLHEEERLSVPGGRLVFGVYANSVSSGPDYRIGDVEIRSPGSPELSGAPADGDGGNRWEGFWELPNILCTDGSEWSLFRRGTQRGPTVVLPQFPGEPAARIPAAEFEVLLWEFLSWRPDGDRPASVLLRNPRGEARPDASDQGEVRVPRPTLPPDDSAGTTSRAPRELPAPRTAPRTAPRPPQWRSLPTVDDLLPWHQPGVAARRAWMYAPEARTLRRRWQQLVSAPPRQQDLLLRTDKSPPRPGTAGGPAASPAVRPVLYRAFDRRYLLAEEPCLDRPRPHLWQVCGPRQIFVVEQHTRPVTTGPGLLFSALVPDADCFDGQGGRVLPLYRDPEGGVPNLTPGLLPYLAARLGTPVSPGDLVAYLAAVVAHPGYSAAFRDRLAVSGVRVPLTRDPRLWREAVALGREVVRHHTFGQRSPDPAAADPPGLFRLPVSERPQVAVAVPGSPTAFPNRIRHDCDTGAGGRRLYVGGGVIAPVRPEVWRYDVGGMRVVHNWFAARRRTPRGGGTSPLDGIRPDRWSPRRTEELVTLLTVLTCLVRLAPRQADLLSRIRSGPLVTVADLTAAGVLPVPEGARRPPPLGGQLELPLD